MANLVWGLSHELEGIIAVTEENKKVLPALEHEVEAFVSELYFAAKKQHKSFNDIFKERVKPFIQSMLSNNISIEEIKSCMSKVKQIWFRYAMKRFPNVVLQ